jgi:hypothetical protein
MVTREDKVEQSVTRYVRQALEDRGYGDLVEIVEHFDYQGREQLDHPILALGYNLDSEGEGAELGSDLMTRIYRFEFVVFGTSRVEAKNIANVVKFSLQSEGADSLVPLLDIDQAGDPEIDKLIVIGSSADRAVIADPEPWQQFVWIASASIEDTYSASLT